MADQKLTALTAIAAATADDLIYLVEDPLGVPLSRKITFDNFQKSITDVGTIATGTWSAGFGANAIGDADIDWGTGAGQVSAVDIPIADGGGIITGTEVETALQENRTAINLNTAAKHTQNTDTALGAGCVAADHGAAATDQVINVCYGTGDPPDPATMTEGALWVKYTA